jgi:FKBP-type peptidyl-prolyl cis-trans isomerase SlyD
MSDQIAEGKVVGYRFTMARADDGEVIAATDSDGVSYYLHGAANIPPGLEKALEGRKPGDSFEVEVAAADAFGDRQDVEPLGVPHEQFGDVEGVAPGASVIVETPDGDKQMLFVAKVDDDNVYLDPNHPLAGVALKFDVEVKSVREATKAEQEHGHPHEGDMAGHEH